MSKIEEGCLAIVVKGAQRPGLETNVGKIVTVGKCKGSMGQIFGNFWEVDKPMMYVSGQTRMYAPESVLERIDYDESMDKTVSESKPAEFYDQMIGCK